MAQKQRIQQLDDPSRVGSDAIFNAKFLQDIPEAIAQWGSQRVLLVASKALAANTDKITALQAVIGGGSKLVHTKLGVGSHSPYADVRDIAAHIQDLGADCVVSVGSCSYSDATKIACLLAVNLDPGFAVGDMEALVDKNRGMADSKHGKPLSPRRCRLICVPTSLSASEWNAVSSATNPDGKKQHFGLWDRGQPDLILLDPEVARTSPEKLWLSSGVRCVDHCVELLCNPLSGEKGYEGVMKHAMEGLRYMIKGLTEYKRAKTGCEGDGMKPEAEKALLLRGISECQFGSREALTGLLIWRVPMGPSHAIGHQVSCEANDSNPGGNLLANCWTKVGLGRRCHARGKSLPVSPTPEQALTIYRLQAALCSRQSCAGKPRTSPTHTTRRRKPRS
jgi:alcohol dehydrogenase class IV